MDFEPPSPLWWSDPPQPLNETEMLIIFNLFAIPVCLVIALVLAGLSRIPLLHDLPFGWILGVVTVIVGGIAETVGVRARLFFLPIWLLGLGVLVGMVGLIWTGIFLVLLVAAWIWRSRTGKNKEAAAWAKLRATPPSPMPSVGPDEVPFWTWFKATIFLPKWSSYTAEICDYNLPLLAAVRESGIPLTQAEIGKFYGMQAFLKSAKLINPSPWTDTQICRQFIRLVEGRLRNARDNSRPPVPQTR